MVLFSTYNMGMSHSIIILFVACLALTVAQPPPPPATHITVLGSVYCDVCHQNTFSNHSYLLPGVDVNIECKIKTRWARSREDISFSVNRSTDRYGMYRVEIPCVDGGGVDCTVHPTVQSLCKATLISSPSCCNLAAAKTISSHITLRSYQNNACIYTLGPLSYTPPQTNLTLCGNQTHTSFNTSKFFLPPYYVFPWPPLPPLPQLPPFPQLPPLPQLPPFPSFPFPPNPPSLPFPFPSVPPPPPSPPIFNFWDPNTWFPHPPPTNP